MSTSDAVNSESGDQAGTEDIEADIARARHALDETTSAVATKLDVPQQVRRKMGPALQAMPSAAVVLAVVLVGAALWRRRRRS